MLGGTSGTTRADDTVPPAEVAARRDDEGLFRRSVGRPDLEGLSEEPANHDEIQAIDWGREPLDDDADLELGPNNCPAN